MSVRHFGTSAEVSGHFGHDEVSWERTSVGAGGKMRMCRSADVDVKCGFQCRSKSALYPLVQNFSPELIFENLGSFAVFSTTVHSITYTSSFMIRILFTAL